MSVDLRVGSRLAVDVGRSQTVMCVVRYRSLCRSCQAPVVWVRTPAGHPMPVNLPVEGQPVMSHFATCPQSKTWRKRPSPPVPA